MKTKQEEKKFGDTELGQGLGCAAFVLACGVSLALLFGVIGYFAD